MFAIHNEQEEGFRVFCNSTSIVRGIPSEALATELIKRLKTTSIDWNTFPRDIYLVEQIEIIEIVKKIILKKLLA